MKKLLMAAAVLMCAGVAIAGPNAGGTLVVATNPALVYTTDTQSYCGASGATDCHALINIVSGSDPAVWFAVAAFPDGSSPRLAGVVFGIQYGGGLALIGLGPCSDFELATSDWPNSGSGTALTWNTARTTQLTEVYWFAGYNYYGNCEQFCLTPHPSQGSSFADDATPANLDPIAALGCLGFNCPGNTPCPEGPPPTTGACCLPNFGGCVVLTVDECAAANGVYQGDNTDCDPDPCPTAPALGACCIGDQCTITTQADCQGQYQGDNTTCDPNPCVVIPTQKSTWGNVKSTFGR